MMKIICVCGMGLGSSLILKMSVESAMKQLGVPCDVEHVSSGTMGGMREDFIVAAEDFRDELAGNDNVVYVQNVIKVPEIKDAIELYLKEKGIL